ncbi:hypothetical protein [Corallococcus terminator]|uniref:Uncharacterized protein n=1 Tax=Corallococcus terminator TaxID=2316733 RepID=A0A3A8IZN5_9BACT|nr:hypothetical protein [Corallococcus terminator]RKG85364.1 hypothetical protein D7V88_20100 [Corallococcus terminator]
MLSSQTADIVRRFLTPANQIDFPQNPTLQKQLDEQWSFNLTGFTQQGITGNPWNSLNAANNTWYFNPVTTDPANVVYQPIQWNAFPGRLDFYYGEGNGSNNVQGLELSTDDLLSLGDTGKTTNGTPFSALPKITNPCTQDVSNYGPFGPRGWQDEYCEWSVERNEKGDIVRIDFTCENPEYWNSLWAVSPERVLELYRSTLGKPHIQLADLQLVDPSRRTPVIDPSTGRPAYNPLNKWNSGPVSSATQGGAMHLTSTPNTIQTEIGLGSAATVPRPGGNGNAQALICCAQYGQPARNSDPHIGQSINQLVAPPNPAQSAMKATLANPPGLYIQTPDFASYNYQSPDGTDVSTFWTIVRGRSEMFDEQGRKMPGHYILHASFQVPASKPYTVSDLTINGQKIKWAGQVAQTFLMQITGAGLKQTDTAPVQSCVATPPTVFAQPLQIFHANVFYALVGTQVPNVMGVDMNLASNSTLIAPRLKVRDTNVQLVITADTLSGGGFPAVSFGDGVTARVVSQASVTYAVPGNTYPAPLSVLLVTVDVSASAVPGPRSLWITNNGQAQSVGFPAAIHVVPA